MSEYCFNQGFYCIWCGIITLLSVFIPAVSFVFQHVLAFFFYVFSGFFLQSERAFVSFVFSFLFVLRLYILQPTIAFKRLFVCVHVCVVVVMISCMQRVENLNDEHVGTQSERNFFGFSSSKSCKRFGILLLLTFFCLLHVHTGEIV